MKRLLPLLLSLSAPAAMAQDDIEKLLVNETFQSWTPVASSTTEAAVTKTTSFSNESLVYKLREVQANPTGHEDSRFNYALVSDGWLMAAKTATPYIELSPLASITRVEFIHGATGSNRGYQLWKKAATDADWVSVSSAVAGTASGTTVAVSINEVNVALKFTNLNAEQNAYLFDLKIWGNYASSAPQVSLSATPSIEGAGTIARSINSDTYDQGTTLTLTATASFGYRFVKWTNEVGATLAETPALELTLNENQTLIAIFDPVPTFRFTLNIEGSRWGEVTLTPAPTNGQYEQNTIVTATVVPNLVTTFLFWDDQSSSPSRTLQITAETTISATFDEIPFIVSWNFKAQEPRSARAGDFYAETDNTGIINLHEPSGAVVNWLANAGSFSPSYPCARKWTSGITSDADFATADKQRYYEASFSTTGYANIRVTCLMGGNYHVFNKQIVQYSLNGEAYTPLDTVDIGAAYNSGWVSSNALLPSEAENQPKVYIRWVADLASGVQGNAADNDGTALTNILVLADKTLAPDFDPPLLVSASPAENSTTASASGTITLTFNERMKAGAGSITLDGLALTPVFGSKTVTLRYADLGYGTAHTLTVPANALADLSDNPFAGTTLHFTTMTRPQPIPRLFDAVVAADGSGDHLTLQAAIDAAPANRSSPWLIYVRNGVYRNQHTLIPVTKPYLHFIGQCRDSVITGDTLTNEDPALGSYGDNASLVVRGANCYFENLTLENTYGYLAQAGPQALAVFANADKTTFKGCTLRGYQDTYFTGSFRHYLQACRIEGAVDFIYGSGDAFFDQCLIYLTRAASVIVAPNHGAGTQWGYVFSSCTIDANAGLNNHLFGRPWQNSPKAVFLNTTCIASISPAGWTDMGAVPIIFADYNSTNAQGDPLDLSQRKSLYTHSGGSGVAKNSLTDSEAAQYTLENVLSGTDSWNPRSKTEATAPATLTADTATISWAPIDYAICYVIYRNGRQHAFTLTPTYAPADTDTTALYTVQVAAESGALSPLSNAVHLTARPATTPEPPITTYTLTINVVDSATNAPITDATITLNGAAYTAPVSVPAGTYAYSVSKTGYTTKTGTLTVTTADVTETVQLVVPPITGIGGPQLAQLAVYPNPVFNEQLIISSEQLKTGDRIEVYSLSGILLKTYTATGATTPIDLSTLPTGTYVVKAANRAAKVVKK